MKFAHIADCHLGGWRHKELRELNLKSFEKAIDESIKEGVDFALITGDLFDSAYPPIEILEETFFQLRKFKENGVECYYIAGSHDYSASGKTFLTVLEKAGFCKNMYNPEEKEGGDSKEIFLNPLHHGNVALYGYPGKKSGMEVEGLKKIKLQGSPGLFRIFALHTVIEGASQNLPIETVKEKDLPEAEYYALGHLHINYEKDRYVYAGPTFPNNFQELEELKYGSFYIINTNSFDIQKRDLKIKDIVTVDLEIDNALIAKDKIISELNKKDLEDKIVLIKLSGQLKQGKISHIDFKEIEMFVKEQNAYCLLKSTTKLKAEEPEFDIEVGDMDRLEEEIISKYKNENPSKFNKLIQPLINSLDMDKKEDETNDNFEERVSSELNKIFNIGEGSQKKEEINIKEENDN